MSIALVEWHRKRRAACLSPLSFSEKDCDFGLSQPSLPSPPPDGSPLAEAPDGSPQSMNFALACSPVVCPSPAEFVRQDFVRRNVRQIHSEYEFERCLGEGSFGKVHQARHRRTGVLRAVKEIPKTGTEDEDFEAELKALVALDHPHIVKVIEYFDDLEMYYLVMELCTGPDVFKYIIERTDEPECEGFLPESECSVILRQCLKSVLCCHANGFVHRDLNAKNFMLTGTDRTIKLIDFGLATRLLGYVPKDQFIEIVGTSHYMAPEMMLNGKYSPAVDIWALGILLYVCLTGLMLLPKDDERKKRLLQKKGFIQRKLETCTQLQKRCVSDQARDLLTRMLKQDPVERISASEALSHPFILRYCHDYLGPPMETKLDIDANIVARMRLFAKAPRLKKVSLLYMAHLADHEQDLCVARHNFRTLDTNGDGEISLEEFKVRLELTGIKPPEDLAKIFTACGGHREGKLHFVEFLACLLPEELIDERLCHEVFNLLDPDSKGSLSAADLKKALPAYDLERCKRMVAQAATAGSDSFDFEDFHSFLCCSSNTVPEVMRSKQDCDRPAKVSRVENSPAIREPS